MLDIHIHKGNRDLKKILNLLKQIIMTEQEAIEKINGLTTQVGKIQLEVQKLIDAAANDGNVSPELQAAIDSLAAAVQTVDDQNEDEATPPEGEQP